MLQPYMLLEAQTSCEKLTIDRCHIWGLLLLVYVRSTQAFCNAFETGFHSMLTSVTYMHAAHLVL